MKRRHIGRLALALFWVMAYGSSAHADSRSRAEVQGGAAFLNTTPALAIGGTGWINRRAGVSARVYFMTLLSHRLSNEGGLNLPCLVE